MSRPDCDLTLGPPRRLRFEHLDHAFGVTVRRTRLSWQLPGGASRQLAYEIDADVAGEPWSSGEVASEQHLFVPYAGPSPASRQVVTWRVRVRTPEGLSEWSEPASWETGLLDDAEWSAAWVRAPEPERWPAGFRPAAYLRGDVRVERPAVRARIYSTAHGVYELFVNGVRVGDAELSPGLTAYRTRLHVRADDVTELVRPGVNHLAAIVTDGWFRGRTSYHRLPDGFGDRTGLLVQMYVDHADGTTTVAATGPDWWSTVGPIAAADLFDGIEVDLRRGRSDWSTAPATDAERTPVELAERPVAELVSAPMPPVRRLEERAAVAVTQPAPGRTVFDFGQNLHGWIRLGNLGPAGTSILVTHAEALDASGEVNTASGVPAVPWYEQPRGVQGDRVTSAGRPGEHFEPRHTRHGFRYVAAEGQPTLGAGDAVAVVVGSDLARTGWFRCSDERVNRLEDIAFWTYRNQYCDAPTAEITRECAGWTDWGFNFGGGAIFHDVSGLSVKWLRDLAADQWSDGRVHNFAPDPLGPGSAAAPLAVPDGLAGWADAAVSVPWDVWRTYGDEQVLAEQYPSMRAWVDWVAATARAARHPSRVAARPVAASHEQFLWDVGFHFGEHLEPGTTGSADPDAPPGEPLATAGALTLADFDERLQATLGRAAAAVDHAAFATAYFARSADLVARTAAVLGNVADAEHYGRLAADVRAAWQAEFVRSDGSLVVDTQATHVRALAFGLVPDELRERVARRLVGLIEEAGMHPGTGLPSTHLLLPVLADAGYVDVAYALLLQDTEPSWLTVADRGGTTFWEAWDGMRADGSTLHSLNLPTRASVIQFLHGYVAGIQQVDGAPGYRRFRVAPQPGGGLTWAEAAYESPYGRIESAWTIDGNELRLDVTIPPGTAAEIVLPDGQRFDVGPGERTFNGRVGSPAPDPTEVRL